MIIPILLAGGLGFRLRPISNKFLPKQFIVLSHLKKSLYELAYERASRFSTTGDVITITNKDYIKYLNPHKSDTHHIIYEDEASNTAASVCYAMLYAKNKFKDAKLIIMPTDHIILKEEKLFDSILDIHIDNKIILFGVRINSGMNFSDYGNIILDNKRLDKLTKIKEFVEKPQTHVGANYINSGIIFAHQELLEEEIIRANPSLIRNAKKNFSETFVENNDIYLRNKVTLEETQIDRVLLEKSNKLFMRRLEAKWYDIGTTKSLMNYFKAEKVNDFNIIY